jgi:uncharacterized protein with von Willebrand factor type A (vWA) domain
VQEVINDFVTLLRASEVRVSPAETLDALRALETVGLGERTLVRDVLRATLVKRADEVEAFERLFDLYFGLGELRPSAPAVLSMHGHDHGGPPHQLKLGEDLESEQRGERPPDRSEENTDLRQYIPEEKLTNAPDLHGKEESLRLSMFAQELMLNRQGSSLEPLMEKISGQIRLRRARNIFKPGKLAAQSAAQEVELDVSAAELGALIEDLEDLGVDDELLALLRDQADNIVAGLPELLKALLERERKVRSVPLERELRGESLRRLTEFTGTEQRELEAAIRRLARRMNGAQSRRTKADSSGRISIRHTVRGSLRYDGIPFDPSLRKRREGRPRLVVLCDVSLSTRNLARFWLHLVADTQSLFAKVRTFIFVADTAEVTETFADKPLGDAIDAVFAGGLIDADVNSDFGRAARQFATEHLDAVTRRTTVVILGDGRNNGRDPDPRALQEIAARAKSVVWLTPEPRHGWQLGSCDMGLYEPLVDRVEVVRSVEQLAKAAERIAERDGRDLRRRRIHARP